MFGADGYIKKDARIIEALRKRGISDLRTVSCSALPTVHDECRDGGSENLHLERHRPKSESTSILGSILTRASVLFRNFAECACHGLHSYYY